MMTVISLFVASVFVFVAARSPVRGLTFYIFAKPFIPSQIALIDDPSFPLVSLERILYFIMIVFCLAHLIRRGGFKHSLKSFPLLVPLSLIFLSMSISTLATATSLRASVLKTASFGVEQILLAALIWMMLQKQDDIDQIFRGMKTVIIVLVTYGIYEAIVNNPFIEIMRLISYDSSRDLVFAYKAREGAGLLGRIQTFFHHPIAYGAFLGIWMGPLYYRRSLLKDPSRRMANTILFGLMLTNIFLTQSRSTYILVIVGGLSLLFLRLANPRRMVRTAVILGILGTVLLTQLPESVINTAQESLLFRQEDPTEETRGSTVQMRMVQLAVAYVYFVDSPIIGHGPAMTRELVSQDLEPELLGAESFLFILMIELGIIGVIVYLNLLRSIVGRALDFLDKNLREEDKCLGIGLVAMSFGYATLILVTGELNTFPWYLIVTTLMIRQMSISSARSSTLQSNSTISTD